MCKYCNLNVLNRAKDKKSEKNVYVHTACVCVFEGVLYLCGGVVMSFTLVQGWILNKSLYTTAKKCTTTRHHTSVKWYILMRKMWQAKRME